MPGRMIFLFVLYLCITVPARSQTDTLKPLSHTEEDVVVTGTMREISRMRSPVPVEVITPKLFLKNPSPALFESIGMVNGVKPQLNCNVCNTGDIHINGMEGPYTLVLIDGMPIVSALSSVYGLSGIPNSLVERIEVVKGPASALYGSEAMGGLINVITRSPRTKTPALAADVMATSWSEWNADVSAKFNTGKKTASLLGISYFNYGWKNDRNADGFTDLALQQRISVFNKWQWQRRQNREAALAARWVYEDRWGGETRWNKSWRGSDSIYGESIYTQRAELLGSYQWPLKENIFTRFSYNFHRQNSWYGNMPYMAEQQVAFVQTHWNTLLRKKHPFLLGLAFRYMQYDDNTPATAAADGSRNQPMHTPLPGLFVQSEWRLNKYQTLLTGYRFDRDKYHGSIHSPRLAYQYSPDAFHTFRASLGTGFRVVNIFTEEHAALTGGREVIIKEKLHPERSFNGNLNYVWKYYGDDISGGLDFTGFYTYFTNKIVGDFDTHPNQIIYDNLSGHAASRGLALNADLHFRFPLKLSSGITYMDVYTMNTQREKIPQLHAPKFSGTFTASYSWKGVAVFDFTGQWNGPMRLPVLPNDFRPEWSPAFCLANLQISRKWKGGVETYAGLKNLFNFVPQNPIMRPFDPFDRNINDPVNNPNGYTFDPAYNYAPLQGIRGFAGLRWQLTK